MSKPTTSSRMRDQAAAEWLGISVFTLRQWRSRGVGPAYLKLGGRVLYDLDDLKAYLDQCRRIPKREVNVAMH